MTEIKAHVEYGNLKKLVKAMSKEFSVKVGLLKEKNGSNEVSKDLDVAGLGAVQEFGAVITVTDKMRKYLSSQGLHLKADTQQIHIPARSFLEMPLTQYPQELRKKIKSELKSYEIENYLKRTGDFMYLAVMIGAAAKAQVQEAFDTSGFGQWEPNHPYTIEKKGFDKPLYATGRNLRDNIDFEVTER